MHTCSGVAKEGVEDACHKRKAFTATVVKVTGTSGKGEDECNPDGPGATVYTCSFLEFLCISSSHLHVHVS